MWYTEYIEPAKYFVVFMIGMFVNYISTTKRIRGERDRYEHAVMNACVIFGYLIRGGEENLIVAFGNAKGYMDNIKKDLQEYPSKFGYRIDKNYSVKIKDKKYDS